MKRNLLLLGLALGLSTAAVSQTYYDAQGRYIYISPDSGAAYVVDQYGNYHPIDPGPGRRELSHPGSRGSYNRYETQRYWNNDMQYGSGACLSSSDC